MKRLLTCLVAVVCLALLAPSASNAADPVQTFMRAKLTHSNEVLEGLTTENFDQIAKHGQELSLLSRATSWNVLQTPEYKQRSLEFRRGTDALTKAGKNKNLDGAALAYVDVILKCVNCHKYVRGVRTARVEQNSQLRLGAVKPRPVQTAIEVRP